MKNIRVAALVVAGLGATTPAMAAVPPVYQAGGQYQTSVGIFLPDGNGGALGLASTNPLHVTLDGASSSAASTSTSTTAGVAAEQNVTVSTTAVTVGTAGTYRTMAFEPMGAPICYTFGSGTLVAPTSAGVCSAGAYVAAGVTITYVTAVPGTVLHAISSGSTTLWYQVQS